uniref:EGF-like domain-containing protein n=1 Tax=Panagrolaimus davidi TaxID=227884 RepID=A0A914PL34_9BILA
MILAKENKWPTSKDAFDKYVSYCENPTTAPPELNGISPADCNIFSQPARFCLLSTTQMFKTSTSAANTEITITETPQMSTPSIIIENEYLILAEENKWPTSKDAYNKYVSYCDNPTTAPSELNGITPDDCNIIVQPNSFCPISTTQMFRTSTSAENTEITTESITETPQMSTPSTVESTNFTETSLIASKTSTKSPQTITSSSTPLTTEDEKIPSSDSTITITTTTISPLTSSSKKITSTVKLSVTSPSLETTPKHHQSSASSKPSTQTYTKNASTKAITKPSDSSGYKTTSIPSNDQTSSPTPEPNEEQQSTTKLDVPSTVKVTKSATFLSSISTLASKETVDQQTTISDAVSSKTTVRESTTVVDDSITRESDEPTDASTTEIPFTIKTEENTAHSELLTTKKYTTKEVTFLTSKSADDNEKTTTFTDSTSLSPTPVTTSSTTTETNVQSTESITTSIDKKSTTTISSTSSITPTVTSTATSTLGIEPIAAKSSQTTTENEKTQTESVTTTSTTSEKQTTTSDNIKTESSTSTTTASTTSVSTDSIMDDRATATETPESTAASTKTFSVSSSEIPLTTSVPSTITTSILQRSETITSDEKNTPKSSEKTSAPSVPSKLEQKTTTKIETEETTASVVSTLGTDIDERTTTTKDSVFVQTTVNELRSSTVVTESAVESSTIVPTTQISLSSNVPQEASTTSLPSKTSTTEKPSTTTSEPKSQSATVKTTETSTAEIKSTTETAIPSTTSASSSCKSVCPSEFFEGDYACFKFIQPNNTQGWQYSDFQNACDSINGVIASFNDFGNINNKKLYKKMTRSKNMKITFVFTNAIPTPNFYKTRYIPAINFTGLNSTNVPFVGLKQLEKYQKVSALCRVGKFCRPYTCPIEEYFLPKTSKYLATFAPATTVLKANETLNIYCMGELKRKFEVKCDRRGYLLPDSSSINCNAETETETESEEDGVVKSCFECKQNQTASCDDLKNGTFYCNCTGDYFGKSCENRPNACKSVTCLNGGTCENRFSYAKCHCEQSYSGNFCQHDFYSNDGEEWKMRFIANAAAATVVVVETIKLPSGRCRFFASFFGALAFLFRIKFESPDTPYASEHGFCALTFSMAITCCFMALSGMIAESILALGIIQNKTTNAFKGNGTNRKNRVKIGKFYILFTTLAFVPSAMFSYYSQYLVTGRSCVGVLPWTHYGPSTQYAGFALTFVMSAYALTASGIALYARWLINVHNFEIRRRYDADAYSPFAYGIEIWPIEIGVRYGLYALRPILFVLAWFAFIASAELFDWWATYLATAASCIYSAFCFIQDATGLFADLDTWTNILMSWAPRCLAPTFNYVTLRTRDEVIKVLKWKKYENEKAERLNGGPEIRYPVSFNPFEETLRRMRTDRTINQSRLLKLTIPVGLQRIVVKKWTIIYLKARAAKKPQHAAMEALWEYIQNNPLAAPGYPAAAFTALYHNFWENMAFYDRLNDTNPSTKAIFELALKMLEARPYKSLEKTEILDSRFSDGRTIVIACIDDPPICFDHQQRAYDKIEKECNKISEAAMKKDEIETAKMVKKYPHLFTVYEDPINGKIIDNRPTTLRDYMLNEKRPNFIGPRTKDSQLPPGVTYLDYTSFFLRTTTPFNWRKKYNPEFYPVLLEQHKAEPLSQQPQNAPPQPDNDDDLP